MILRPRAVLGVLRFWRRFPRLAASFAAQFAPCSRFVVCGHSHRPGAWTVDGRVILNTGHFEFPARPYAVLLRERSIELRPLRPGRSGYELGEPRAAAWPIPAAAASAVMSTPVAIPEAESR